MERMHWGSEKENTVVGIRADGNPALGMGHLMRCLSIACALRELGQEVVFFLAEEEGRQLIEEKGFACAVLHTDYQDMESETEVLLPLLKQWQVALLIVDSYQRTPKYCRTVKGQVDLVCMEEEIQEIHDVDGIINYNIYAEELPYDLSYGKAVKKYLGSTYAPLRPEFAAGRIPIREKAVKMLITMGGSDMPGISGRVIERFLNNPAFEETEYEVICGGFNPHREELMQLAAKHPRVHIRVQVTDMAAVMKQCDMAVAAAGSTMYELSALGVPAVCCYYVENQKKIADCFGQVTRVINAGDYRMNQEMVLDNIEEAALQMLQSQEKRQETADSMAMVTDGQGAVKLAGQLLTDFVLQ